jgi:hypothetical protein
MDERALRQGQLAADVNDQLRAAGHAGSVSERTVRNWLAGKTRWPHQRQRDALTAVFRCTPECLGFIPPARHLAPPPEDPNVIRRHFCTATTGVAAAAVPLLAARPSVGASDVRRLREGMAGLTELDQTRGGHSALEKAALAGAAEAVSLQRQAATQRIRQRLFSVAADFTAAAAWSCIDARQRDRAQQLLNEALRFAGMAQDPVAQMRVWNATAMLAHQSAEFGEVVAASQAAQATVIARRDPLFGSLAHARTAIGHAALDDRQAAIRSLGYAEDAMSKATDLPRPAWIGFYGPAELHALTAIVRDLLGEPAHAEAASYRALAVLPEQYRRNRAMATVRLALAQLHQGDADQACDTAGAVFEVMAGDPLPGRLRTLLGDFHRDLLTLAPSATTAKEWGDRYRTEWSPQQ